MIHSTVKVTLNFVHFLYYLGHEKLVEFLLRKGANINGASESEDTPLHLAASEYGNLKHLKCFIAIAHGYFSTVFGYKLCAIEYFLRYSSQFMNEN